MSLVQLLMFDVYMALQHLTRTRDGIFGASLPSIQGTATEASQTSRTDNAVCENRPASAERDQRFCRGGVYPTRL